MKVPIGNRLVSTHALYLPIPFLLNLVGLSPVDLQSIASSICEVEANYTSSRLLKSKTNKEENT